jgi:hypothetical protein
MVIDGVSRWVREEIFQTGSTRGVQDSGRRHRERNNDCNNGPFTEEPTTETVTDPH